VLFSKYPTSIVGPDDAIRWEPSLAGQVDGVADEQWVRGKSLDTFCPLHPALVTEDEIGDPEDLEIWSELNCKRMQQSITGNLIFGLDALVSFCSNAFTLLPGDVILTGTPTGVGFSATRQSCSGTATSAKSASRGSAPSRIPAGRTDRRADRSAR